MNQEKMNGSTNTEGTNGIKKYNPKRKFGNRSKNLNPNINIIPIGGTEFIGANCTAIEYENDIIVIDAGIGFPSSDSFGVDFYIPNPRFLKQNSRKIKGLVITHAHLDHIGAIPYLIEHMGFPTVYASEFAKELISNNIKYNFPDLLPKVTFKQVNRESEIKFGGMDVSFFGVNHSIPESMGVIIKTKSGTIVHTGDFKFDNSPMNEPPSEYGKIANVGEEGVLCLLSDSTNSYREGHSMSEREISAKLEDLISDVEGRVVIATFSSMVNRIIELLKVAQTYNRKVFVSGRSMQNAIDIGRKIGYIKVPNELFITGRQLSNYPDNKVMILATGSQGESLAALGRMARQEHRDVKVKDGDTIILSSSVIPGNGASVQDLIDNLSKLGATVYHNEIMNLHTTGHGHKEEQKLMINLVKPKFFMPVHGFQSFLTEHGKTAISLGVQEKNIIIPQDGSVIEIGPNHWKAVKKFGAKPVAVSGSGVGDVGDRVLADREQLASFGVFIFSLLIDKKSGELIEKPDILSRGFVYMKQSKELIDEAQKIIENIYNSEKEKLEVVEIREIIIKKLKKYFFKETEREPMLLALIKFL